MAESTHTATTSRVVSLSERAVFLVSRAASGHELPYATLMYVWSNRHPMGTVIPNPRTRRIEMVVASSGGAEVGKWQTLRRNLFQDFERAFGERPGRLTAVGVLTDTDNTGANAEAWVQMARAPKPTRPTPRHVSSRVFIV